MNNLHLSDEAQADLAGIKSYIAKNLENPSAAISTVYLAVLSARVFLSDGQFTLSDMTLQSKLS